MPLKEHVVLLDGKLLRSGFQVLCSAATKGRMKVIIDNKLMEEATLLCSGAVFSDENIEIGKGVTVEPGAMIKGPAIIGDFTEIRQGAYVRGDCLLGNGCTVGHTTEIKHSIFLDGATAGHFAYIGDSILGHNVNLGAGTKFANLKFAPGTISVVYEKKRYNTERRKLGAILGDDVQTGCNAVTNPGTILGCKSLVGPNMAVKPGVYGPQSIIR